MAERLRNRLQSDFIPVRIRTLALSYPFIMSEFGGHSGGAIPVPIPNTEDKSASVPYCTEVRESSGTLDRCQLTHTANFFVICFLDNEAFSYAFVLTEIECMLFLKSYSL